MRLFRDILLYGAVVAAPLAVGSVHTLVVAGLAAVLIAVWGLGELRPLDASDPSIRAVSIPSLAFWLFGLVCLLQILPLPAPLHELLNPTGRNLYLEGWGALFGESTPREGWRFLSLDPGRTCDRGLRWLTLALAAGLGLGRARREEGWEALCRLVLVAGLAVVVVGALQVWFGTDRILFVYQPSVPLPGPTTFVNDNHAAALAGLASLAGFFLAFRAPRRTALEGVLSAGAAIGLMILMFAFDSAGTTLAFVLAMGLFLVLFAGTRTAGEALQMSAIRGSVRGFGIALLSTPLLGALAIRFGPASWSAAFWRSHLGVWLQQKAGIRLEMARASLEATGDFWLVGAGAGATERVLPPYIDWGIVPPAKIPTIENEPVEWLFQYGVPVGVIGGALLLSYGWFLYRRYDHRPRFRYAAGLALTLYVGILAQFHFPFFTLGVTLPAVVLLEGLAFPTRNGELAIEQQSAALVVDRGLIAFGPSIRRALFVGSGLLAVVFTVGYLLYGVDLAATDSHEAGPSAQQNWQRLVGLIPADGDLYIRAAFETEASRSETAVRRARFAYQREPKASMGIYVAHVYRRAGRRREALELYRKVYGDGYTRVSTRWIRTFILRDFRDPADIAEILQDATSREWNAAARLLREEFGPDAAASFGLALQELRPEAFRPHEIVVEHYLRMDRAFLAEAWIRQIMSGAARTDAQRSTRLRLLVRVLLAQNKQEQARRELLEVFAESPIDNARLAGELIELRPERPAEASSRAKQAIAGARRILCESGDTGFSEACWKAKAWLHEYRGDHADARSVYRGISETSGDPRPLARHLARTGACDRLEEFVDDWYLSSDSEQKHGEALTNIARRCRSGP